MGSRIHHSGSRNHAYAFNENFAALAAAILMQLEDLYKYNYCFNLTKSSIYPVPAAVKKNLRNLLGNIVRKHGNVV